MERILENPRREEVRATGPVRTDRLGAEYDVMCYLIFARTRLGYVAGGTPNLEGTFVPGGEGLFRSAGVTPTKGSTEAESLLSTIIEKRCLTLSKRPAPVNLRESSRLCG